MAQSAPLHRALAHVIRARREQLGLSQEQLGDRHRNTVGKIERAEMAPTALQLQRLAEALGTTGSELLADAERLVDQGDPIPEPPTRPARRTPRA